MPVPQLAKCKVLVTGASGFVAAWVVRSLLERGHHVRGTVRSANKGSYLQKLFKEYGTRFEYVVVEDMSKSGAFDDACKGMDAVIHVASPFHLNEGDPQDVIGPAVNGMRGILESILKSAPTVKRVVLTSSASAMSDLPHAYEPSKVLTFTEKDWYLDPIRVYEENGKSTKPPTVYSASKTLAERAAWEFLEEHKAEVSFDLVALNPTWVFGPIIHEVASPSALNVSIGAFFANVINKPSETPPHFAAPTGSFVDVRDLAWAHAECLVNDDVATKDGRAALEEGAGRVLLRAGEFSFQDLVDALNVSSNALPAQTTHGETGPGAKKVIHHVTYDCQRARDVLGVKFRPLTETVADTRSSFRERGWVE